MSVSPGSTAHVTNPVLRRSRPDPLPPCIRYTHCAGLVALFAQNINCLSFVLPNQP